ncbi:MAG: HNH endonuclease [Dehalococcoidia bacterium]|nr:HNH endonuclease [Dehalococcoidia bacterium]
MARRSSEDPVEKVFAVLLAVVIGGTLAWELIPHWIIYTAGAIVVCAVAIGIVFKIRGGGGFGFLSSFGRISSGPNSYGNSRDSVEYVSKLPPISSRDQARLRQAVGDRCENPFCKQPEHRGLHVHHIVPRSNPRSTNQLDNLIVLCPNCHDDAGHGRPSIAVQQTWAQDRHRFVNFNVVRNWNATH